MGSDKPAKYERMDRDTYPSIYELVTELVAAHHTDIVDADIDLVWVNNVKPDKDGHVTWGFAKKVGALEREFHKADFVIALNKFVWGQLPDHGKRALLDHELSHCGVSFDEKTAEPHYYTRKHDLEEFVGVARRHGLWRSSLEDLVNAALKREQLPLPLLDGETVDKVTGEVHAAVKGLVESIPEGVSLTLEGPGSLEPVTIKGRGKKKARA